MSHRWRTTVGLAALAFSGAVLALAGCNRTSTAPTSPGAPAGTAQASSGEALFKSNGCDRCHALAGQGGRRAPDLTHVASDPAHTQQWIADQISNPQSHNPQSRMPAFKGRIPDADIQTLAAYLAQQK